MRLDGQRSFNYGHVVEHLGLLDYRDTISMNLELDVRRQILWDQVRSSVSSTKFIGAEPMSAWDAELDQWLNAQKGPVDGAQKANDHLADLLTVGKDDLAAGIAELKTIQSKDFPYLPNVLALLHTAELDQEERTAIRARMMREFPDAIETLETVAPYIAPKNWLAFRVHKYPATRPSR